MNKQRMITFADPKSPAAEAFRTLRTNIMFSATDKEIETILFTSSSPGEGKSTISANYAITLTQSGQRVILVDCDMRRPTIHKVMGLNNKKGLTNMLIENATFEEVAQTGWVEKLKIITTGPLPPNPAELIGSAKMDALIETLKEKADVVLFDAPPLLAVTDSQLLASKLDGVVLVIKAGAVTREMAVKAKELLGNVKAKILGCVMNKVEYENKSHYYYYK